MLASTVQFSKYGRSPTSRHRQTPDQTGRYDIQWISAEATNLESPLPQDPTACLRPDHPHPPRSTLPEESRTSSKLEHLAELVSVPPSSSVTNTRDPPQLVDLHGPRTALDHTHEECGQCSLERR